MSNKIIKGMGFHHIALRVKDLNKSLEMYKALGLEETTRWGEGADEIVMMDIGDGGIIEFFANGNEESAENERFWHFAMGVDNVEDAYNTAIGTGFISKTAPKIVPLDSKPEKKSINVAFVIGPDGEELEFFKEV